MLEILTIFEKSNPLGQNNFAEGYFPDVINQPFVSHGDNHWGGNLQELSHQVLFTLFQNASFFVDNCFLVINYFFSNWGNWG